MQARRPWYGTGQRRRSPSPCQAGPCILGVAPPSQRPLTPPDQKTRNAPGPGGVAKKRLPGARPGKRLR